MPFILLVEDDNLIGDLYKTVLETGEYEVEVCNKSEDVETYAAKYHPDLIVLDLMMPHRSGMDVLKDLKENPAFRHIPVIMFSNLADDEKNKQAVQMGVACYAVKNDYPPRAFLDLIAQFVSPEKNTRK